MKLETQDNAPLKNGQELVEEFLWHFEADLDYRALACHAALPLVLTPELLKFLRHEFLPHLSWVAEVDLLLSKLCAEAAEDLYVMQRDARAYLIGQMRQDPSLGETRIEAVNRLLIGRLDYLARNHPALLSQEWETQRLSAMLYVTDQRDHAARALSEAIYQCLTGAGTGKKTSAPNLKTELSRLTRLVRESADTLKEKEYEELVRLAKLTGKILSDRSGQYVQQLRSTGELAQTFRLPGIPVQLSAELLVERISSPNDKQKTGKAFVVGLGGEASLSIKPGTNPNDPWKGVFGGASERNHRRLKAIVKPLPDSIDLFSLQLTLISTDPDQHPLRGNVMFYFHPAFNQDGRVVSASKDGKQIVCMNISWGAFTVGVEADDGETRLELDLAEQADFPYEYRQPLRELLERAVTNNTDLMEDELPEFQNLVRELQAACKVKAPEEIIRYLSELGSAFANLGDNLTAIEFYERALRAVHKFGDRTTQAEEISARIYQLRASKASRKPFRVYISYAHHDIGLKDELLTHLRVLERRGQIFIWDDRGIVSGPGWEDESGRPLDADIELLLISSDFLASDFISDTQIQELLERQRAGRVVIVPVILRPCDWSSSPFGQFQALPANAKPINSWSNRDEAYRSIVDGLRKVVDNIREQSFSSVEPVQQYDCFISYSQTDAAFARKLYSALERRGVRCWLDEKQLVPGDDIYQQIERGIRLYDKVLLCISQASLNSSWVEQEIRASLRKEEDTGKRVLIPLLLDNSPIGESPEFEQTANSATSRVLERSDSIDFRNWDRSEETFESQLSVVIQRLDLFRLSSFEFETVTLDARGQVKERRTLQARQFLEELAPGVTLSMVEIPGGEFIMGSPEDEAERLNSEGPLHSVAISPFFMGKFAITQAQWRVVAGWPKIERELKPEPSYFPLNERRTPVDDERPVEQVSWDDAQEFCARLSQKTGRSYRLPTESEWEYACRAGTTTPFAFGETVTPEFVNYDGNHPYSKAPKGKYRKGTVPVGSLGVANPFGLFDMHGNVYEWCQDWFGSDYYAECENVSGVGEGAILTEDGDPIVTEDDGLITIESGVIKDPQGPENGQSRVLRGGSWFSYSRYCRSAFRDVNDARYFDLNVGFRVVVSAGIP